MTDSTLNLNTKTERSARKAELEPLKQFFLTSESGKIMLTEKFTSVLAQHAVRVPRKDFDAWLNTLQEISQIAMPGGICSSESEKKMAVESFFIPLGEALNEFAFKQELSLWTRTCAVATVEILSQAFNANWPTNFWEKFCPEASASLGKSSPLLAILNELYSSEAQKPLGGPLQFYYLAQVCKLLPNVIERGSRSNLGTYKLDEYLNALELTMFPRRRVRTYHLIGLPDGEAEDWCFRYLANAISRRVQTSHTIQPATFVREEEPWELWASWMRKEFRGRPRNHNVAILGVPCSGRNTMVKLLEDAIWNQVSFGPPIEFHNDGTRRLLSLPGDRSGEIRIPDSKSLSLTASADKSDKSIQELRDCATIILVVPAFAFACSEGELQEELQSEVGRDLIGWLAHATRLLRLGDSNSPQYSIAIAFTMADEYGAIMPEEMRIFETAADWKAFLDFAEAIQNGPPRQHASAWQDFVSKIAERRNAEKDVALLRKLLLNGTRVLWQSIARDFNKHRAVVNGYLVQAKVVLDSESGSRNWEESGFLQIFADMLFEEG